MGLRCLLGHDFGEPELRREREEDGNEVVTTVTEVKTCARCGEAQVVSENTEVTTMEQLTDEATAAGSAGEPDPAPASDEPVDLDGVGAETDSGIADEATTGVDSDVDDAVIIDDTSGDDTATGSRVDPGTAEVETAESDDPTPTTEADTGAKADTEAKADTGAEAAAGDEGAELLDDGPSGAADDGDRGAGGDGLERDDGVILDEEGEAADDRERGAWPDVDGSEEGAGEPTPWPEHGGEDEGFSAEVAEGDAGDVEFGGGLTPEAADPPDDGDTEYVEASEPGGAADDAAATGAGSAVDEGVEITRGDSPNIRTSASDVTTEYYCPECEMTRSADGNSMRAGDICPECKRGYIDERPI
ncbi:DUF7093 family protein [Halorubrum sp. N11]|uniref:DUF7093 family protein n=1 Tax=Halorubrum sp. N11 TaxID=3402276 RepID=UPI003EC03115